MKAKNHIFNYGRRGLKSGAREGNLDEPNSGGGGSDAPEDGGLDVS